MDWVYTLGAMLTLSGNKIGYAIISSAIGNDMMDSKDEDLQLLGVTTTCGVSSSLSTTTSDSDNKTEVAINVTQTYVESLSREELLTLQELLQEKQIMIENQSEDQISRSLNRNTNI